MFKDDEPNLECFYCGHRFYVSEYTSERFRSCPVCKDTHLKKLKKHDKIDQYQGCPPFPEKTTEKKTEEYYWG